MSDFATPLIRTPARFAAADGRMLQGYWSAPDDKPRMAVVFHAATGVPAGYYRAFWNGSPWRMAPPCSLTTIETGARGSTARSAKFRRACPIGASSTRTPPCLTRSRRSRTCRYELSAIRSADIGSPFMTISIGWIGSSRWRAGPRIGWPTRSAKLPARPEPLAARRTGGDAGARLPARTAPRAGRGSAGGGLLAMATLVSEEGLFQL